MAKTIYTFVTNDLSFDQRLHKICSSILELSKHNQDICLVGQNTRNVHSKHIVRPYKTRRIRVLFKRGILFYAFYNVQVFCTFLFVRNIKCLVANDLDTLVGVYMLSLLKRIPVYFDAHELFIGVPELENRRWVRRVWTWIERIFVPKCDAYYTVSPSIAQYYKQTYHLDFKLVRNFPCLKNSVSSNTQEKIMIYQGSVNKDRGLEELVFAMPNIRQDVILWICGTGDVFDNIQKHIVTLRLENRVKLWGGLPFDTLHEITCKASLGLSIEKLTNKNYMYALPNKVFDYVNAGVPVLFSNMENVRKLNDIHHFGFLIKDVTSKDLATRINDIFSNPSLLAEKRSKCLLAKDTLCWEQEEKVLSEIYNIEYVKKTGKS